MLQIPVYDERSDRYYNVELDVALKDKNLHCFHPLAANQPDVETAIEDSKQFRNPHMLADALHEELTMVHKFNSFHLKEFLKRFFVLTFPPDT